MDATQEILSTIPLDQLAAQLGTDEATAQDLASQLIPALIGGMSANAADDSGARSLASALSDHADSSLLDGGVSLDQVDTQDGEAIVKNVFGARTPDVTQALGRGVAGGNNEMVQKLLRILAPIVLAYVASKLTKGGGAGSGSGSSGAGGGILGSILDSILGGGRQQAPAQVPQQPTGGSLQDILLDMLGGAMGGGAAAPQRQPQQPAPRQPEFEQPRQQPQQAPANPDLDGPAAPTIPIDEPAQSPQGRSQQPGGFGGQGGGILGDLLDGLLGGGRRA